MADPRNTSRKTSRQGGTADAPGAEEQAARLSRGLSETAQQIWLAGVGALARAQTESTRLFEGLVKEGMTLEQSARDFAGGQADLLRDTVDTGVGSARERATSTWGQFEKLIEDGVHRTLARVGVPSREDIAELTRRIDALSAELRQQQARGAPRSAAASGKTAAGRPPLKRATAPPKAAKKIGKKAVAKKTTRQAGL